MAARSSELGVALPHGGAEPPKDFPNETMLPSTALAELIVRGAHPNAIVGPCICSMITPSLPSGGAFGLRVGDGGAGLDLVEREVVDADILNRRPEAKP